MKDLNEMSDYEKLAHLELICEQIRKATEAKLSLLQSIKSVDTKFTSVQVLEVSKLILKDIVNWEAAHVALHSAAIPYGSN